MLGSDCLASVLIGFEMGKIVTQKDEIWQLPLCVLREGKVIGLFSIKGEPLLLHFSPVCGTTHGEPSQDREMEAVVAGPVSSGVIFVV